MARQNFIKKAILFVYFKLPENVRDILYKKYRELVKGDHYKKYFLCSVLKYGNKYLQSICYLDGNNTSQIYYNVEGIVHSEREGIGKDIDIPIRYVAELHNISILSGGSFLLSDENSAYMDDIQCLYSDMQYVRSDDVVMSNKHAIWVRQYDSEKIIEKGIFLIGFRSTNYYHLTIEILSRLKYVDDLQKYNDWPILIDSDVCNVPQYRELVDTINIFNHPIIYVNKGIKYKVNSLIYPSPNTWVPFCIKQNRILDSKDLRFSREAFLNIRSSSLKNVENRNVFRRIFVSRANAGFQRLVNEKEIQALFEKYGFEIVYPENMSYRQQVLVFHEAKCIAGMSGAAMTNLIYCADNATYITFSNDSNEMYFYPTIARLMGLECHILPAEIYEDTGRISTSTFIADVEECERYLKSFYVQKL